MIEPFDIEAMRAEWPIDDDHRDTTGNHHCDTCSQRMPCDWSRVVADLHQALDAAEQWKLLADHAATLIGPSE